MKGTRRVTVNQRYQRIQDCSEGVVESLVLAWIWHICPGRQC